MGDVVNLNRIEILRRKSDAHRALVRIFTTQLIFEGLERDMADFLMERLWKEGFKIVPRDDDGEAA